MDIQKKKLHLIQEFLAVDSEKVIDELEAVLNRNEVLNSLVQKEMNDRAMLSEEDIKDGKVYTLEEAEDRINRRLGI